MNKRIGLLFTVAIYLSLSCESVKTKKVINDKFARYDVESGVVYMTIKGQLFSDETNIVISFSNYGEKELTKMENKMMGKVMEGVIIKTDSLQYMIFQGQYIKARRKYNFSIENFDLKRIDEKVSSVYEIKKIREEIFLEKMCNVYSFNNKTIPLKGEFYEWNKIPLKIKIERGSTIEVTEAYKLITDTILPKDIFTIPANVTIVDATSIDNN